MLYQLFFKTGRFKLPLRVNFYKTKFLAMFMTSLGITLDTDISKIRSYHQL
jgi:hypothetical protein